MRDTKKSIQQLPPKANPKAKTRYIVTHEYTGSLSMQNAFQEVIEHKVCNQFEQWKDEKLAE